VRRSALAALGGACLAPLAALAVWLEWPLPARLLAPPAALSLVLEDRNGTPLRTTRAPDGSRARWLPLAEMDPQLIQAFVASEDRRFYGHRGVDLRAAGRALLQDVRGARVVSGASTITMQLARLLRPGGRGWRAKAAQALWALRLERHLGKQAILEQYLDRVPLGQGAVGVAAAAALYFDASAGQLSLGQAALLAGLASAPSADNPFVSAERSRARRGMALRRMVAVGYATPLAADEAAAEPVASVRRRAPFLAPHFTSQVLAWAEDAGTRLEGSWRTSLDLGLQAELEGEVRATVALLRERGVRQAAAVVLDNRSGEVRAWVGSPDFWSDTAGQVDMVVSPRQPGSALKPFLYGLAFDRGISPATVLADVPHTYQTATGPYQPRNYDRTFHGPVRAREALASSFNVPAVELTDRLGAASLLRVLHEAGFASLARGADHYGLGLALGNGDVTLLEMANGYRGLAAGGVWTPVRWTEGGPDESAAAPAVAPPPGTGLGRTLAAGTALGPANASRRRFVSRGAAALVLDILSDPVARVPGFGADTPFDFGFPVAVKTGTSHHFTDNWAVGVTGGFTVAVWVGNFSGRPMRQVSGVTGAGPLLHRALVDVARRYEPGVLASPAAAGAVRVAVCRLSGLLAGAQCPGTEEWFLPGTEPAADCDWHRPGGTVAWPAEYAPWAQQNGRGDAALVAAVLAAGRGPGDRAALASVPSGAPPASGAGPAVVPANAEADSGFRITSPLPGDRYQVPPGVDPRYATIALRAAGAPEDAPVRWYVDGRPTRAKRWQLRSGAHAFRAVARSGRVAEAQISVR
jgi:penicillin-binding protein 1C